MMDLFDKKDRKKLDKLSLEQAKLNNKQVKLNNKQISLDNKKEVFAEIIMNSMDRKTLQNVFEIVEKHGHPKEKSISEDIRKKYDSGKNLSFDDWGNINTLYKSNYKNFANKDVNNE